MADTLKTASETVASGKSLWENIKPLLTATRLARVAKNFFGFSRLAYEPARAS